MRSGGGPQGDSLARRPDTRQAMRSEEGGGPWGNHGFPHANYFPRINVDRRCHRVEGEVGLLWATPAVICGFSESACTFRESKSLKAKPILKLLAPGITSSPPYRVYPGEVAGDRLNRPTGSAPRGGHPAGGPPAPPP